jgi:hypothetical protein
MTPLDLVTNVKAVLTKTVDSNGTVTTYPCDLNGDPLGPGVQPLPIYRDRFTAKTFVRIAEVIPSSKHPADVAVANDLVAKKPIHFANADVRGWFVEAPDFNEREGK